MSAAHRRHPLSTDLGLLLIRLILAAVFIVLGAQKLFGLFGGEGLTGTAQTIEQFGLPAPTIAAVSMGGIEFFGGMAFLLGTGLRLAAVPLAAMTFAVALLTHPQAFDPGRGAVEFPLLLGVVTVGMLLTGPGRWTIAGPVRQAMSGSGGRRSASVSMAGG